jgi:hypothetical protein
MKKSTNAEKKKAIDKVLTIGTAPKNSGPYIKFIIVFERTINVIVIGSVKIMMYFIILIVNFSNSLIFPYPNKSLKVGIIEFARTLAGSIETVSKDIETEI